jgi:hypothetical protein
VARVPIENFFLICIELIQLSDFLRASTMDITFGIAFNLSSSSSFSFFSSASFFLSFLLGLVTNALKAL